MQNAFTRRRLLQAAAAGSVLPLINPLQIAAASASGAADGGKYLFTLETGHNGDRGGPIAVTRDKSVLWFTTEPEAPYLSPYVWPFTQVNMRESRDSGGSWPTPEIVTRGSEKYSVLSHAALQLRSGILIHVHTRYSGYHNALNPAFIQYSSDGGKTWTGSSLLPTAERYISDVLSIAQTSAGRVIYPFGFLTKEKGEFKVSVLYSDDEARTWTRSSSVLSVGGMGFQSGASEPSVAELPDGRLWMLIRAQTGFLWESFSSDGGKTWETARPSGIPCSNAPGTALRLSSGQIAVVWNNHDAFESARQSLAIALTDDGHNFHSIREIDHTDFPDDPEAAAAHVTYPFLAEGPGGAILVSYNKGHWLRHNHAKVARIEPGWVQVRKEIEDFRNGRVNWCTVAPGAHRRAAVESYAPPEDNRPGASLEIKQPANSPQEPCGMTRNIPLLAEGGMQVVLTVAHPECYLLWHHAFLAPGQVDEACLRVRFSKEGAAFLAAGIPISRKQTRKGVAYSYVAYPITMEQHYPGSAAPGKRLKVRLRFSAAQKQAWFSIDNGPEVSLATGELLGLYYFGIAVTQGGVLRLRGFEIGPRLGAVEESW